MRDRHDHELDRRVRNLEARLRRVERGDLTSAPRIEFGVPDTEPEIIFGGVRQLDPTQPYGTGAPKLTVRGFNAAAPYDPDLANSNGLKVTVGGVETSPGRVAVGDGTTTRIQTTTAGLDFESQISHTGFTHAATGGISYSPNGAVAAVYVLSQIPTLFNGQSVTIEEFSIWFTLTGTATLTATIERWDPVAATQNTIYTTGSLTSGSSSPDTDSPAYTIASDEVVAVDCILNGGASGTCTLHAFDVVWSAPG